VRRHVLEVRALGQGGQVADLHVFEHALPRRGHSRLLCERAWLSPGGLLRSVREEGWIELAGDSRRAGAEISALGYRLPRSSLVQRPLCRSEGLNMAYRSGRGRQIASGAGPRPRSLPARLRRRVRLRCPDVWPPPWRPRRRHLRAAAADLHAAGPAHPGRLWTEAAPAGGPRGLLRGHQRALRTRRAHRHVHIARSPNGRSSFKVHSWPRRRSIGWRITRIRSSSPATASAPTDAGAPTAAPGTETGPWILIEIGGHLAMSPLPHHRAYGSVPRRFGRLSRQCGSR